jgi:UDP-glucose 4-epimerase
VSNQHALLRRIVDAAEIDTVIDTRLVVDSGTTTPRLAHENNVIGTMNILAGCSGPETPVRKLVFKSSAHFYGCEQDDPSFFTEKMGRPHPARTPIEKDIVEAEKAVRDFAERNNDVSVTVLRFANGIGADLETSHLRYFGLPVVPTILGFDPRYQFIHDEDMVGALEHVVSHDVPGVYNVAADGVLALTEVLDLLDKRWLPLLAPWGTGLSARGLRTLGVRVPPEMLRQLRFGRGLDNRRLKAAGYSFRYTTREAIERYREAQRVRRLKQNEGTPYRYEREVEEFLRRSPSVRIEGQRSSGPGWRPSARQLADLQRVLATLEPAPEDTSAPSAAGEAGGNGVSRGAAFDELRADEVIAILPSLEPGDLEELRRHETEHRGRTTVLGAIDRALERSKDR